jgi:hypothetical protein
MNMIDVFDIMAFVAFAILLAAVVIIVVTLGSLPGQIAQKRCHPQAAAINVASWLGIATGGLLWPLALIWAFLKPSSVVPSGSTAKQEPPPTTDPESKAQVLQLQARVDALEAALRELGAKEVAS